MPKYYCDYCEAFLTHDSPSVRKTHCTEAYKSGKVPPPMFGAPLAVPPPGFPPAFPPPLAGAPPGFGARPPHLIQHPGHAAVAVMAVRPGMPPHMGPPAPVAAAPLGPLAWTKPYGT
ncbi:unnamed protein product [Protopolystoma xenopodis]|uniref:Matrin-type domain-containing protein n=1 Tax=Protopolystoma xenopodis TaxID=117903 RepID=A0A3S5CSM4_9PLAT|nr:unnamed protein product [Protopolystoma xenopodis]